MKKDKLHIVYNRSELGAGTRGASIGIDALLLEAIREGNPFFSSKPSMSINDQNHILSEPIKHKWAKHIKGLVEIYDEVCSTIASLISKDFHPLIISGDHASAGGTVAGIKKAFPKNRLGIVWIDAHADLHSPYTSPSGNIHGMPLATMLAEDNLKFSLGDVPKSTEKLWNKLKNTGAIQPKVLPEDIVFIGVRDTEKEEDYLMKKHAIKNFSIRETRTLGVQNIIETIQGKLLKECDIVYVSFDVDSLDSELVSKGTGTPVKNGLTVVEAKDILKHLLQWDKVIALEITEINPLLDNQGNKMAATALDILSCAME